MTQLGTTGEDEYAGRTDTEMMRKIKEWVKYRGEEEVAGGAACAG